jgi:predicted alpha/beta hydrolase family esterase
MYTCGCTHTGVTSCLVSTIPSKPIGCKWSLMHKSEWVQGYPENMFLSHSNLLPETEQWVRQMQAECFHSPGDAVWVCHACQYPLLHTTIKKKTENYP